MIKDNSELLFIYDAKMCNPNGDIDDENRPRMDKLNRINLVTDVRLKRYIRDYFEIFTDEDIFVTQNAKDATDRGKYLKSKNKSINDCIDVKMFGSVEAQKTDDKKKGENSHLTGPIQFTWGESLNKVDLLKSKTITSSFSSGEGIGSDYRVKYSLIAFSGTINAKNANKNFENVNSGLTEEIINKFNMALIKSIPLSRTRSKIGQFPRLYLKIDLDNNYYLKDLREYVNLIEDGTLNDINDVRLDITNLINYLIENNKYIYKISFWHDDNLILYIDNKKIDFALSLKKIKDNIEIINLNGIL